MYIDQERYKKLGAAMRKEMGRIEAEAEKREDEVNEDGTVSFRFSRPQDSIYPSV